MIRLRPPLAQPLTRLRPPISGMDDFDFTITLYYWGKIGNNPYRYKGGEIKIYEDNNFDEMSLVEIWNKAKDFGYGENDVFMYRVPTMPFAGGLKPLENDVDVMNMVKCINDVDVMNNIYSNLVLTLLSTVNNVVFFAWMIEMFFYYS
ncbi:hypothetical protein CMV_028238 [Castanea mollissima]|uniref:PB1-like domain-containing protein n=1 Tax=Castanea mollissima TaxID=60419 RepID=A0A8J4Q8P0_9ROSI|nr:hypothetical protein CMV_028238 [Castanea mollissima]